MILGVVVLALAGLVSGLTSVIKQGNWSDKAKNFVAVALSVPCGVVAYLISKDWDVASLASLDLMLVVTSIYGFSQAIFGFLLKGTETDAKLENLGSDSLR